MCHADHANKQTKLLKTLEKKSSSSGEVLEVTTSASPLPFRLQPAFRAVATHRRDLGTPAAAGGRGGQERAGGFLLSPPPPRPMEPAPGAFRRPVAGGSSSGGNAPRKLVIKPLKGAEAARGRGAHARH